MINQPKLTFITLLFTLVILVACSPGTSDWETFSIEEEPAIDIQFQVPTDWQVDYAPSANIEGQWDVTLLPPKCSPDQNTDFDENCISLTINIKDRAEFDKTTFLNLISRRISLGDNEDQETLLVGQYSLDLDGLTIQRYNHKFKIDQQEVQMSIFFFETDNAYYTFITELPYDQREGEIAQNFEHLLGSIEIK